MSRDDAGSRVGLSLVCVFNDPTVREECLDASVRAGRSADPDAVVELVAVDNVDGGFSSAGAALNHGVRRARHDVVVLVHQDVYLHSLRRLAELGSYLLDDTRWAVIGACGVTADGAFVGTLRDRVQMLGGDAPRPVVVDTVDEVLLCARRDLVLAHPLTEDPDLAWHAYAAEYCLRLRDLGLLTGAANAAITHHSRSTNLDRLDVAHARLADLHADAMPVRTTCGVVAPRSAGVLGLPLPRSVRSRVWRRRWLAESTLALRAGRSASTRRTVLADIRLDVDLLDLGADRCLRVVGIDPAGGFADHESAPLRLTRGDRVLYSRAVRTVDAVVSMLRVGPLHDSWLITNLSPADLCRLASSHVLAGTSTLLGVHERTLWLLVGPVADHPPDAWSSPRAVPLLAGPGPRRPRRAMATAR